MKNRYYRVLADPKAVDRWHLMAPVDEKGHELDARLFTSGEPYKQKGKLAIPLRRAGEQQDFNFGDFDMPVVKEEICQGLRQLGARIECLPVAVESTHDAFNILNVLDVVQSVDEERSEITKWTEQDQRPDKVGQYRMITKLAIDPAKVSGQRMFRIAGWRIALVADETIKKFLENKKVRGIFFQPVS